MASDRRRKRDASLPREHVPPQPNAEDAPSPDDRWVFAYGSLMWNPDFAYSEVQRARLHGYHRALCILSLRNRGTPARPGLALGLDRGGSCTGYAFRVPAARVETTMAGLWAREMSTQAYTAKLLEVRLADARRVSALVFVARTDHPQYVCGMPPEEAARLVAQGRGTYGTALDYLRNTLCHLDAFGIIDPPLRRILALAECRALASGSTQA